MLKEDLAWAAGFIDGDGCIYCDAWGQQTINLEASQVDLIPLRKLKQIFGGVINKKGSSNNTLYFYWKVKGNKAIDVLEQITPYLVVKKKEARTALLFKQTIKKAPEPLTEEDIELRTRIRTKLVQIKDKKYNRKPKNESMA